MSGRCNETPADPIATMVHPKPATIIGRFGQYESFDVASQIVNIQTFGSVFWSTPSPVSAQLESRIKGRCGSPFYPGIAGGDAVALLDEVAEKREGNTAAVIDEFDAILDAAEQNKFAALPVHMGMGTNRQPLSI
jgi:hypothetical protein